jgi:flagellar hook-associated protein 2
MGGALSSLGAASGVLTYDVIDKLKKADEAVMITPFKTRLTNIENKSKALSDLTTQISLFKTSIADFKDGEIFQKRLADVSGSSVEAKVSSGVSIQNITMDVSQLATNDIYQSKGYDNKDSKINNTGSDQIIKLAYSGEVKELTLKNGATLQDLQSAINDAKIGITASIINTGSDSKPYKLVLKGDKTGEDNIIKLDFGNIDDLGFNQQVYQSKEYSADTDKVNDSGSSQDFKIKINGTQYSMSLDDGATVSDMVDKINNGDLKDNDGNSLSGIDAEFSDGHIKLHLQQIGDIQITDNNLTTAMNENTTDENDNRLQTAQNSKFKYNGVDIERDTNEIDDIVVGLTLTLKGEGKSTIDIKQDTDKINSAVNDFVSGFNSIVSKIQDLTNYNPETKTTTLFQNESVIKNIPNDMSNLLFNSFVSDTTTKYDRNQQTYNENISLSATDFGFTMNRTGFLDFDSSKFADMLKNKPEKTEEFLSSENGAFSKILDYIDSLIKGPNSSLELLSTQYSHEKKSYEETIESSQKRIDTRYEIMASQFASYDAVINGYNVQTMAIQQAIDEMSK